MPSFKNMILKQGLGLIPIFTQAIWKQQVPLSSEEVREIKEKK